MKLIGEGNTAKVYEWEEDKVLKLFHSWMYQGAIEQEFKNAMAVNDATFLKPRAYELIEYNGQWGIIYDKIVGYSLLEDVLKTQNVNRCATYMADIHKQILKNEIEHIPNYKDNLEFFVKQTTQKDSKEQERILEKLEALEEGNQLCHGDFHPGNLMLVKDDCYVIDFMNICHGPALYDIARTYYLVKCTPVPRCTLDIDLQECKNAIAREYIKQMGVTEQEIAPYLEVITVARKSECPDET